MTYATHPMFARRRCSSRPVGLGKKVARRGVASVEGAFALSALFLLLFGLFDMGIGVLRHTMLSITRTANLQRASCRWFDSRPGRERISGDHAFGPSLHECDLA